jgi:hypothetical protein
MKVSSRARRHPDRGGDPLDGLVNMFDIGLVLAVAFLLAALQSADLTDLLTKKDVTIISRTKSGQTITVKKGETLKTLRLSQKQASGTGQRVGEVYRLADGRLVYVTKNP